MPNRTICAVLGEMRRCCETLNFAHLRGLIEEAQTMANRMEASLYDKDDYTHIQKKVKQAQKQLDALKEQLPESEDEESKLRRLLND